MTNKNNNIMNFITVAERKETNSNVVGEVYRNNKGHGSIYFKFNGQPIDKLENISNFDFYLTNLKEPQGKKFAIITMVDKVSRPTKEVK